MTTVAIFTTTRAEFSIYLPLLQAIERHPNLEYRLFVGGSHLSDTHGWTMSEIQASGVDVSDTFPYLVEGYNPHALALGLSTATHSVADVFERYDFDLLCVVGDRYELLAPVGNAILFGIPILHLHGGERTEGAIDEQIRHMVTKASHLHAVACEEYRQNVISLGEQPWRVHNTGALGIDRIASEAPLPKAVVFAELGLREDAPVVLMTYHSMTREAPVSRSGQIDNIFDALAEHDFQVVVTLPNVDTGFEDVVNRTRHRVGERPSWQIVKSLGSQKYHSLVRHSVFVIGNSSSGIIEVPYLRVPTIDIGDRQKGRFKHPSVVPAGYSRASIARAILVALSDDTKRQIDLMKYEFGAGCAAQKIINILDDLPSRTELLRKELLSR
ncbi:UDP-N-acetylglucosamine 2-epimerase (hydrolyzing) [Rhodothermus sp. AH-315-K08]|nr:UDP-N-acetylglucosamine 2-epimerase (hydrolyzing) [Rhodothermus sp. AH-315-K08]